MKDKPTPGLDPGNVAPDFRIESATELGNKTDLQKLRGQYVLVNFWASYDAQSRMLNASLNHAVQAASQQVKMVSVSFDEYESVFVETIRKDQIVTPLCFYEVKGVKSGLYKKYNLSRGFTNYLLDDNGIIVAKNISATELSEYLN